MLGTIVMISSHLVPRMGGSHVSFFTSLCLCWHICSNFSSPSLLVSTACGSISLYSVILKQGDKARVIQTFLFLSGVNTLLQTLIGTRLPIVMNPSFAFFIPVMSIIEDFSLRSFDDEHEVNKSNLYSLCILKF